MQKYKNHYKEDSEIEAIKDFKKYLAELYKKSKIMIITNKNIAQVREWFLRNNLLQYIENISNPVI